MKKIHLGGSFFIFNLVFSILCGIVLLYLIYLQFHEGSEGIQCIYKAKFGKECPTCGFTRSFVDYLNFQFESGINRNKASFYYFLFSVYFSISRLAWVFYTFYFQKSVVSFNVLRIDIAVLIVSFILVNSYIYIS